MKKHYANIVIAGQAGQGLKTIEKVLSKICKKAGYHVFSTREYMSRIRGGVNTTTLIVSSPSSPMGANIRDIDLLISLTKDAVPHVSDRIKGGSLSVGENVDAVLEGKHYALSPDELSKEFGGTKFSSMIASGIVCGLLSIEEDEAKKQLQVIFSKKDQQVVDNNIKALSKGYRESENIRKQHDFDVQIERDRSCADDMYISGADTVAAGALAGGCTFVSSYPMSPATAVLTTLGNNARTFNIVVEQAEDEIAAANMAVGAWSAGGRALATTSGGGFALMTEGVSLAGMLESPMVVHVAQRPGPATGLPTRTAQGDLSFVLYGGHGYFPKAVFAPGTVSDGYEITARAFDTADRYQVPAIILTDQYYMDTHDMVRDIKIDSVPFKSHIVESDENYKRHVFTDSGISPRSIPGYGKGVVKLDSDEHDEEGHITESMNVRKQQVYKRRKKDRLLVENAVKPKVYGLERGPIAIIGWGSTEPIIQAALKMLGSEIITHIHYTQVFPLPEDTAEFLSGFESLYLVENSVTGSFAHVLAAHAGVQVTDTVLKYDGISFFVEELYERFRQLEKVL